MNKTAFSEYRKVTYMLLLIFLSSSCSLFAQGSGSVKGKVVDSESGEPVIGANVVIVSTSIGTSAGVDGSFFLRLVPAGKRTIKASSIGYAAATKDIEVTDGAEIANLTFRLKPQSITGEAITVTAQVRGQDLAINQQVAANTISNVVSSARIQELPDANAAESIGRLPGVSLVRSGGQATQVAIRGLQPKYNAITVEGVQIPANDIGSISTGSDNATPKITPGGRAVDLSMISSASLDGIEVYKTITADMDAAAIGGTVNFDIRRARENPDGGASIALLAQGGYNDLMNSYKDYKFVASAEKRFFDDKLGVFVQGIAQRQNLSSDQLGAYYDNANLNTTKNHDTIGMQYTKLSFISSIQKRYDGTVTLDYKIPNGELALVSIYSYGTTIKETHSDQYQTRYAYSSTDRIIFGTSLETDNLNVISNILSYKQTFGSVKIEAKVSNAYSDNTVPNGWYVDFQQQSTGTRNIPSDLPPSAVVPQAQNLINLNNMYWTANNAWSSFNKQDDKQAALDVENSFNFSDLISLIVKGGGAYKYTTRYYNFDYYGGSLNNGAASKNFQQSIVAALPWLADAPYNFDATGNTGFPISGLYNTNMNYGKFFGGNYKLYSLVDASTIDKIINAMKGIGSSQTLQTTVPDFRPDQYQSVANDYSGHEIRTAGYLMATLNIGPWITIIPGVRYQALKTSYMAAHFIGNADQTNPYPNPLPYTLDTEDEYHGYWLPDISIKYNLSESISLRASFTNTIAYPDFSTIIPKEDVASSSGGWVVWNNYALKPERAHNYDVQVAIHDNTIGLFAVSPFLKIIDDQIFNPAKVYLDTATALSYGLPAVTGKAYSLTTYINNPYQIKVWGIETEWQTHFWYLPGPLGNLVMNVNYTHIFSEGKFPYTWKILSGFPVKISYVDTSYTDRLYQQPNDVVNLSLGWDYGKFSILASMIYQSQVFDVSSFWWTLRSDKTKYLRWDLSVKQGLPWYGLEVYFDVNDLNKESDIYTERKNGFPAAEYNYGLTADLGIRWKF
jgi:TonB-dependent receptor